MWKQKDFVISSFQVLNEDDLGVEYIRTYAQAGFTLLETMMPRGDGPAWRSLPTDDILKVIVNKSFLKDAAAAIAFRRPLTILEVNKSTGTQDTIGSNALEIRLDLKPGEGRLLQIAAEE